VAFALSPAAAAACAAPYRPRIAGFDTTALKVANLNPGTLTARERYLEREAASRGIGAGQSDREALNGRFGVHTQHQVRVGVHDRRGRHRQTRSLEALEGVVPDDQNITFSANGVVYTRR
jgi:hypothetical protein